MCFTDLTLFVSSSLQSNKNIFQMSHILIGSHILVLFVTLSIVYSQPSLCTLAASCATVNLRTGGQTLQMDSLRAMGPSWLMPYLGFPRPYCEKRRVKSLLMQCHRCLSPCWERCLYGSVKAAVRVWKRRRGGVPRSKQPR